MLGTKVFLELFVKIRDGWRENPSFLNELDWRTTMSISQHSATQRRPSGGEGPVVLPK
ncbi:MAG: hypothetical protein H7Y20_07955 [Bryobacteraceae bacterium]|nr:hypothetical protein [Bryobacteraceae bacterium]